MHGNGASVCAHLEARVRELEAALALLTRRIEEKIIPRVLASEDEIASQHEAMTELASAVHALANDANDDQQRRQRSAAQGERR